MTTESRLYQPSNGSEGDWFTEKFCMKCIHCNPDPTGKKQCDILCRSLGFNITDPQYPREWIYNDKGKPTCTAHKPWDWNKQGDPDDPKNPNYVQPEDPAQLKLIYEPGFIEDSFLNKVEKDHVEQVKKDCEETLRKIDDTIDRHIKGVTSDGPVVTGDGIIHQIRALDSETPKSDRS